MTSHKLDRRKKYTRMVLKESLFIMLKEKQLYSVTVKEICELADINRSTFYAHYADQFDLLEQIEEELLDDLRDLLGAYQVGDKAEVLQITEKIIQYFAAKKEECQILLSQNSHSAFEQKVRQVAQHYIMQYYTATSNMDPDTFRYVSAYVVSGSIEVMKVWLNNDMDKPAEEIAKLIMKLSQW